MLYAVRSSILVNECKIIDNYSSISGGSFYLEDSQSFIISNLDISNSTANYDVNNYYSIKYHILFIN